MQGAQMGARQTRSGTAWGTVAAILIAIVVVGVIAYYAIAGSYGGSSPNAPYNTAAPATAPGATAPAAPTSNYP